MNKIPCCLLICLLWSCAAVADEPKKAHIKVTDGPVRIGRPKPAQQAKPQGTPREAAVDPSDFSVGLNPSEGTLQGLAEKLYATERAWLPSQITRSSGISDVNTTVTIALCPPSTGPQRLAWNTLMTELADPELAGVWRQWQDAICNAVLESRILGRRVSGRSTLHVKILRNGEVRLGRAHSPFDQAVHQELTQLASKGIFKIPSSSRTTEVHALIMSGEQALGESSGW